MSNHLPQPLGWDSVFILLRHKLLRKHWKRRILVNIQQKPRWVYMYAQNIIKGRWPEGERVILQDSCRVHQYARDVIQGRWPEAETLILQDPGRSYWYAREVVKGRWPEAEPLILQHPRWAYYYARDVIQGRWPEAEPYILQDPYHALWYTLDVVRDRWPEAEAILRSDPDTLPHYQKFLILFRRIRPGMKLKPKRRTPQPKTPELAICANLSDVNKITI